MTTKWSGPASDSLWMPRTGRGVETEGSVAKNDNQRGVSSRKTSSEKMWPMGAVTRRTGIGEHTLRAWERRFGFPTPHRLESGHRRYTGDHVRQLILISKALDSGHRAGDVVPLSRAELEDLLRDSGVIESGGISMDAEDATADILEACRRLDRDSLVSALRRDASVLGVARFLRERVAPLLHEVGEEWSRGGIEIRHEHFFSEVLEDEIRRLRGPLQLAASGRPVVLASLPNEIHALGLQVAALAVAAAGRTVRVLGPHLPADEIVQGAEALEAAAVGISMSLYASAEDSCRELEAIRDALPKAIEVWLGGAGAAKIDRLPRGVTRILTLDELDRAIEGLEP